MPNRVIREDYLTSERIAHLTPQGEIFFFRLMLKADDFGRYTAHTGLLKAGLFPLKLETIREADISRWIAECEKAGLIALYEGQGKKCLVIHRFHQRSRAQTSKWPTPPPGCLSDDGHMSDTRPSSAHVFGGVVVDGDGGGCTHAPDPAAQEDPEEPAIPTLDEIKAFGANGAAIPMAFCEHYHSVCCEKHRWITPQHRLIDWRREIVRWWAKDRERWKPHAAGEGKAKPNSAWEIKARIEAIDDKVKEIETRGHEDAFGVQIQPKDKEEYKRLKTERKKLRNELAG